MWYKINPDHVLSSSGVFSGTNSYLFSDEQQDKALREAEEGEEEKFQ